MSSESTAPASENPLYIHNIQYGNCNIMGDNRFRDPNGLYCWRSRIQSEPECIVGEICSPLSYSDARSRFCYTFGGSADPRKPGDTTCVPNQYVGPLPGEDPFTGNIRGGIVTYEDMCKGISGRLRCLGKGLSQSIHHQTPGQTLTHVMLALGGLLVVALIVRYTGVGKSLRKLKVFDTRALKPRNVRR